MTEYTKIVDPGGSGDYTSIAAWEACEQTLYSSGDIAIADCRRTTSAKDTTVVNVSGWTSGVIPKIVVNDNYRHEGKYADVRSADGNYIYVLESAATWTTLLQLSTTNAVVNGLIVKSTSDNHVVGIGIGASGINGQSVNSCITTNCTTGIYFIYPQNAIAYNNIVFDCDNGITFSNYCSGSKAYANCVVDCGIGFTKTLTLNPNELKNNIALNCTTSCYSGTFASSSDKNVSSDSSAPGVVVATLKTGYSGYFADYSNNDFHLADTGLNLFGISGDDLSTYFTTDIDGSTRSTWDVGPDEYITSGLSTINDTPILNGVSSIILSCGDSGVSSDIPVATNASGSPIQCILWNILYDSAQISNAVGVITQASGIGITNDVCSITSINASALINAGYAVAIDASVMGLANGYVLSGEETGVSTDVAVLANASAMAIAAMIGNSMLDAAMLAKAGVVTLAVVETAIANGYGTMTAVPPIVLVSDAQASSVDASVMAGVTGWVIPGVEIMSVADYAALAASQGLAVSAFETLVLTDLSAITLVNAWILTAATATDHDINAIFGTPVLVPVLSGRPVLQNKLQGTPLIIRS